MIITVQSRPCSHCRVENEIDAAHCHSCGQVFRCARVQVIDIPVATVRENHRAAQEAARKLAMAKIPAPQKSVLKRCVAKIEAYRAKKYDISSLHFE